MTPERIRARAAWRALPRRLYTRCCRCGEIRYSGGNRRNAMRCWDCFEARSERQLPQAEKADRATHVIVNDGSLDELERRIGALMTRLTRSSRSSA